MPNIASICVYNEQHIASGGAYCLDANLAIVAAFIGRFQRLSVEDARCVAKSEAALIDVPLALRIIPFKSHLRYA